ncbi:hypothetical protein CTEN210_18189 [Chaetoceros tenuissimus]|uniref:HSF-type DNA-binding domain-containing protein n=1 Tax=Chaetoceros tenuissimus TaxID=426638 RepID=A0AAD3HG24_9STRA|nr:hypothetical protein CTEN210_18189 [Chaetoceros tenuissimus]
MNFDRQLKRNINRLEGVQDEKSTFMHSAEQLHLPMRTSYYSSATYSRIKDTPSSRSKEKVSEKRKQREDKDVPVICTKGGVKVPFPVKLMDLLNLIDTKEPQLASIISWQPSGESFKVRDKKRFEKEVQSHFFTQTNYTSFRRQLNLWGFKRIDDKHSEDCGAYLHPMFKRNDMYACRLMRRLSRSKDSTSQDTAKSLASKLTSSSKNSAKVSKARRVSSTISNKKNNDTTPSPDEIVQVKLPTIVSPMNKEEKCMHFSEKRARRVSEKSNISYWSDEEQDHISSSTRTIRQGNLTNDACRKISMDLSHSSPSCSSFSLDTCQYSQSLQENDLEPIVDVKECTLPRKAMILFLVHAMQESDYFQTEEPTSCHDTFDQFVW